MTKPTPTGVILCKLGAILLFIDASKTIGMLAPSWVDAADALDAIFVSFLLLLLVPVAVGLILWKKAEWICGAIPESFSLSLSESLTAKDILVVGIMLLGLYAAFFGVVSAIYTEGRIWPTFASETMGAKLNVYDFASRISNFAQIILGVVLIVGRNGLANWMLQIRRAGTGAT